jgi:transcriptional regulator with XRE-family HTH domain
VTASDDEVLAAIDELCIVLRENTERNKLALKRAEEIRRHRAAGWTYREIVDDATKPLIVELTRENLNGLMDAGGRVRRLETKALHDEGMTMEEIARVFGVTRQRISALLREAERAD